MLTDIHDHLDHYAVLAGLLTVGLGAFVYYSYSPELQLLVVLATSVFFVFWGIIHHSLLKDLTAKIVLEYLLIAALSALLLGSLLAAR